MPEELFWLTLTILMTALFCVPYVLSRIVVRGLWGAMANPTPDAAEVPAWTDRAERAHRNAIENLVLFAPLVLASFAMGLDPAFTATAAMIYFFARAAHFVIYAAGIPVARTLLFAVGFAAQLALALRLLGVV